MHNNVKHVKLEKRISTLKSLLSSSRKNMKLTKVMTRHALSRIIVVKKSQGRKKERK